MCEQCEWENPVIDLLEELLEKYADWAEHTDDFTESTVLNEVIDDLRSVLRSGR